MAFGFKRFRSSRYQEISDNAAAFSAKAEALQNYGTNVANLATGGAAAEAAGRVGAANAISGGIQNAGNMFALSRILGQ